MVSDVRRLLAVPKLSRAITTFLESRGSHSPVPKWNVMDSFATFPEFCSLLVGKSEAIRRTISFGLQILSSLLLNCCLRHCLTMNDFAWMHRIDLQSST